MAIIDTKTNKEITMEESIALDSVRNPRPQPVLSGHTIQNFGKELITFMWDAKSIINFYQCVSNRLFSHTIKPTEKFLK